MDAAYALLASMPLRERVLYLASWVILLLISGLSMKMIREAIAATHPDIDVDSDRRKQRDPQQGIRLEAYFMERRALYLAIIIGLVLTILLFKQPYLDQIFGEHDPAFWLQAILFGGGLGSGWVVWYLKQLDLYGEFFNVLLLTVVTGFCWYARLTAPEEIQLAAAAFILGSLFHIAKRYIDRARQLTTPGP